ncbi:MAG TPA: hypothetical protein VLF91_06720 [Candidatus Saccharimonadales bacterium]|nr:hypothetical protein [Candidatus Saccharimonadales bacterium]
MTFVAISADSPLGLLTRWNAEGRFRVMPSSVLPVAGARRAMVAAGVEEMAKAACELATAQPELLARAGDLAMQTQSFGDATVLALANPFIDNRRFGVRGALGLFGLTLQVSATRPGVNGVSFLLPLCERLVPDAGAFGILQLQVDGTRLVHVVKPLVPVSAAASLLLGDTLNGDCELTRAGQNHEVLGYGVVDQLVDDLSVLAAEMSILAEQRQRARSATA